MVPSHILLSVLSLAAVGLSAPAVACPSDQFTVKLDGDHWGCQKPDRPGISGWVSWDSKITFGEATLAATGLLSAMMVTFATLRGNRRAVNTFNPPVRRSDDPWAVMFDSVADELSAIGGSNPADSEKPSDFVAKEVDYASRYGQFVTDKYTVTVNDTEAAIRFAQPPVAAEQPGDSDQITGFKIIWANSKVDGCYYTRHYSKQSAQDWAGKIAKQYFDALGTGRSSCTCLRDRSDKGFAASITFEGESNNNGKFDHIRCDCGWEPGLKSWWDSCPK